MSPVHDERANVRHPDDKVVVGSRTKRLAAVAVVYCLVVVLLYAHLILWPQLYSLGQVMPVSVHAPLDYSFTNAAKLAKLTGDPTQSQIVRMIDPKYHDQALKLFDQFLKDVRGLRTKLSELELSDPQAASSINDVAERYQVEPQILLNLIALNQDELEEAGVTARQELDRQMSTLVTPTLIGELRTDLLGDTRQRPANVYVYFMRSNLETAADPAEQYRSLAQVHVQRGDTIIARGEVVNENVLEQLKVVRPKQLSDNFALLGGLALLLLGGILLWYLYLRHFASRSLLRIGAVLQFGTLFFGFLALGLIIGRVPVSYLCYATSLSVAALACLVVLVYDARFAAYFALGLAIVLSLSLHHDQDMMVYMLGAAIFPTVILSPGSRRRTQVIFALLMGLFNSGLVLSVSMIGGQEIAWQALVIAFVAGFGAVIVALGLLPVVETISSQLTSGKLLELANQENELLKRLKREAHGTFIHCLLVADLAEEACKDIEAAWMMARVGALYHDIGKLRRPGFFAENIHDLSKNPHLGLPPLSSVRILKDHVADGLSMAKESHIPRELHRFIVEHHGTYLIRYFYHIALQQHQAEPTRFEAPDMQDFCYNGPIPQSRESGVVMLADVTEAVTRARGEMDAEVLKALLDEIVAEKLAEGQLLESQLTVGDLERIKAAFLRTISGQWHQRVRYPKEPSGLIHFHRTGADADGLPNRSTVPTQ